MRKIKGTSTAAISTADLNSIIDKGRGRDRHKASLELDARARRMAEVVVIRGPLDFECPKCGALAGQTCVTPSGNVAKDIHKDRRALAD